MLNFLYRSSCNSRSSNNNVGAVAKGRMPDFAIGGYEFKSHLCYLTINKPGPLFPAHPTILKTVLSCLIIVMSNA